MAVYKVDYKATLDTNEYNSKLSTIDKNTKQSSENMSKGFSSAGLKAAAFKAAIAGAAVATAALLKLSYDSLKAFQAQERAETRLESIAKKVTNATDEQIESLKELSGEMQKITTFGDEVVISLQSQLASFGLNTDQIKLLTESSLDMLAATKGTNATQEDAINIANMMGKAYTGLPGNLSRVGILLDDQQSELLKTGDEMTRVNTLIEVMQQNYGGLARDLRNTTEGEIQAAKNAFGDMQEAIGERLSPTLKEGAIVLKDFSESMIDLIKIKLSEKLKEEQTQANILINTYTRLSEKTNLTSNEEKIRVETFNQLKKLYPDILGDLSSELSSYDEIQTALQEINKSLKEKIILQVADEEQQKVMKQIGQEYKSQVYFTRQISKAQADLSNAEQRQADWKAKYGKTNQLILKEEADAALKIQTFQKELEKSQNNQIELENEYIDKKSVYLELLNKQKKEEGSISSLKNLGKGKVPDPDPETREVDYSLSTDTNISSSDLIGGTDTGALERLKKLQEERKKLRDREFEQQLLDQEANAENLRNAGEKELKDAEQSNAEFLAGEKAYNDNLAKLGAEANKEREEQSKEELALIEAKEKRKQAIFDNALGMTESIIMQSLSMNREELKNWAEIQAKKEGLQAIIDGAGSLTAYAFGNAAKGSQLAFSAIQHGINAAMLGAVSVAIPSSSSVEQDNEDDVNTTDQAAEEVRQNELMNTKNDKMLIINTSKQDIVRQLIPEINDAQNDGFDVLLRGR